MKLKNNPVQPEKIQLIHDLLNSYPVNELWLEYVRLGMYGGTYKEREKAWNEYCVFRDKYLGLPPLSVPSIQQTYRDRIR